MKKSLIQLALNPFFHFQNAKYPGFGYIPDRSLFLTHILFIRVYYYIALEQVAVMGINISTSCGKVLLTLT